MELERELSALAAELEWPPTPSLQPRLEPRRRGLRRPLAAALAAVALALAVAFAVPQSRAAILRYLHLGAATVQLVGRLPAAQERPLGARLGPAVTPAAARQVLHDAPLLPPLSSPPTLRAANGVVSLLFIDQDGKPVLLSELYDQGGILLKKLAGAGTRVQSVRVGREPGLWLSGTPHLYVFPGTPPRLAGNVLLWQHGPLTLRLEGRTLTEERAQQLARALR